MQVTVDELVLLIGKQAVELDQQRRQLARVPALEAELSNAHALADDLRRQLAELTTDDEEAPT